MADWQVRTEALIGEDSQQILKNSTVAVFGLGGVGSYTVEGLARAGVGTLVLIDGDIVAESNINRQLYALNSTLGMAKTKVAKERVLDINSECNVITHDCFFTAENVCEFDFSTYDFVVDAIDMVSSKILLIETAKKNNTKIICSMGAGNKLDATKFQIADISKTTVCPLAKVVRQELKKRNITNVKVVFSTEERIKPENEICDNSQGGYIKRNSPSSISFVPSVAGLLLAGEVIKELIKNN